MKHIQKVQNIVPQWLVIGGCPRSGTTLLNLIVNTHPQIRVTNETSLTRMIKEIDKLFYREKKIDSLSQHHRVKSKRENWDKSDIHPIVFQREKCILPVLRELYRSQFMDQIDINNARYFGDKYPMYYSDNFEDLKINLKKLKVIHISRNPLDTINSMMRRASNSRLGLDRWDINEGVESACLKWIEAWNFICRSQRIEGNRFLHIKYEDLISESQIQLDKMSDFLGVYNSFDDSMIVSSDEDIRSHLSDEDCNKAAGLLQNITERWGQSLDELVSMYPYIEKPDDNKNNFITKLLNNFNQII